MEQQGIELSTYISIFKRRKWFFIIPAVAIFCFSAIVVMLLPAVYQSSAVILVEGQEVPQELIQTTVTGYVEERLKTLSQRVLSRANLMELVERYGLYQEYKETMPAEQILEMMRSDIHVENIQAEAVTSSGREITATIAFTLSYEGKNPQKVLQTTNALVSLFLEGNLQQREEKAQTTYSFLEKQLEDLRDDVKASEAKIAAFKEEHFRSLPELMELNLQSLDRVQKDIDVRQEMIKTLMDRKVYLQGQLATIEPSKYAFSSDGSRIMTPEEELKSLRSQYLTLKSTHSEKHPDVIKLKNQIEMLESELSGLSQARDLQSELTSWRMQLAELREKYTDKHPDVISAQHKVAELEAALKDSANKQSVLKSDVELAPDNPAYINLKTQIQATDLEIRNERNLLEELRKKYEEYVSYIELSPQVEQEYRQLQRDYANSSAKYEETMQKLLAARQAQDMEREQVGERLSLVEPPVLAEKPVKPKRMLLLAVSLVLSMGVGVGTGTVVEFLDASVHGRQGLKDVTSLPVLGIIPYVETKEEQETKRKRQVVFLVAGGVAMLVAIVVFHFAIMPLDIFITKVLGKFGLVL